MKGIRVYVRDRGPICYEAPAFNEPEFLRRVPQQLLLSGLAWYWKSARGQEPAVGWAARGLPAERSLTHLTRETVPGLEDDFWEDDVDGNGRYITLAATDGAPAPPLEDGEPLRRALQAFVDREEGEVRAAVLRMNDVTSGYIFVPHAPVEAVLRLLRTWGITSATVCEQYRYERLYLAQLENSYFYKA